MFYIAEIGLNHNGKLSLAKEMVSAAQESGADAVKFQSLQSEELIADSLNEPINGFGFKDVNNLRDFWNKVSIDRDFHLQIKQYCDEIGIEFMSTPFDENRVDLLDELEVERFKIASGDLTHYPLIQTILQKNKPIILSTGGSNLKEIHETVDFIKKQNFTKKLTLLHCVSLYPTPPAEANLTMIDTLKQNFETQIGFSDHTRGFHITLAAIARGAEVIEKHFTIDNSLPGPDQQIAAEPDVFQKIVEYGKEVDTSLENRGPKLSPKEKSVQTEMRRSIVAAHPIEKGTKLKKEDLKYKRPATGISPKYYKQVIGLEAQKQIKTNEQINWEDIND